MKLESKIEELESEIRQLTGKIRNNSREIENLYGKLGDFDKLKQLKKNRGGFLKEVWKLWRDRNKPRPEDKRAIADSILNKS